MSKLLIDEKLFKSEEFEDEEEFEKVVVEFSKMIFGQRSVYFDIKKKIKSKKGKLGSIPDAYLISFFDSSPKLFIVENEISAHDELKIGQQIMKYQATFSEGQIETKNILMGEIRNNPRLKREIDVLLKETHFANVSEMLDQIIFDESPGFIVTIDEASERLHAILKPLSNNPEVIEVRKFVCEDQIVYQFSDFEFEQIKEIKSKRVKVTDVDTIVCPAREEGFKRVFLGENRWYEIRISPAIIPQIKYIAMYEAAPISAIRWVGIIQAIRPYKDTGKYEVIISEMQRIKPIKLPKGAKRGTAPQAPRYTKKELLDKAKTLNDLF